MRDARRDAARRRLPLGLYTSPHLLRFNERARIDGVEADDGALITQFEAVERARADITLTYFEFTTLAILRLFAHAKLDATVLEVGLGGRLDAVNIVDADVSVVTSVAIDHVDYLGATRELIGSEKAHIYRPSRPAICSDPEPPQSLLHHAHAIGADLWRFGRDFNYQGDRQQWAYAGRHVRRASLPYPALRGANQLLNASGALAALEAWVLTFQCRSRLCDRAVNGAAPARFQVLPGRPATVLDVAHNPHAAAVLAQNLDMMGFYPRTHAVFGMLNDKDIGGVVARVGDRIDHWYAASTMGARGASAATIAKHIRSSLPAASVTEHPTVTSALASAREHAKPDDRILAFGSFVSVAEVMRAITETSGTPQSTASHATHRTSASLAGIFMAFWRRKDNVVDTHKTFVLILRRPE